MDVGTRCGLSLGFCREPKDALLQPSNPKEQGTVLRNHGATGPELTQGPPQKRGPSLALKKQECA